MELIYNQGSPGLFRYCVHLVSQGLAGPLSDPNRYYYIRILYVAIYHPNRTVYTIIHICNYLDVTQVLCRHSIIHQPSMNLFHTASLALCMLADSGTSPS